MKKGEDYIAVRRLKPLLGQSRVNMAAELLEPLPDTLTADLRSFRDWLDGYCAGCGNKPGAAVAGGVEALRLLEGLYDAVLRERGV